MMSFLHYICFINFAPMQTLNITLPTSWSSLTDHQLQLVYKLFAEDYTSTEVKTLCLLKWNHLKVAATLENGRFLMKQSRKSVDEITRTAAVRYVAASNSGGLVRTPTHASRSHCCPAVGSHVASYHCRI